ncbi:hypothetical protein BX616_003592 [Lobosporangium transversale]|nr:hypothetical protein BX616_003592 [Lobosporangium transversale]
MACVFFEYGADTEPDWIHAISYSDLAAIFNIVAEFSRDYSELSIPCEKYIYQQGLKWEHNMSAFMAGFRETNRLFPYVCEDNGNEILVPGLSPINVQDFLWRYAEQVADEYKDDIAILINKLRYSLRDMKGSGGILIQIEGRRSGCLGVLKFTAAHNRIKMSRRRLREAELDRQRVTTSQETRTVTEQQRQHQEGLQLQDEALQRLEEQRIMRQLNINMYQLEKRIMNSTEQEDRVSSFVTTLSDQLNSYFSINSLTVHLLGSFANGLSSHGSDYDLTVEDLDNILGVHRLGDALRYHGYKNVFVIPNARVPIVTFRNHEGVNCDISINAMLGVENSKLIKTYVKIDHRVRVVWFTLKKIAEKCGILSAKHGFLSSYALTLMLITFLQSIKIPVLPSLQQQPARRLVSKQAEGVLCSFDHNWSNYVALANYNTSTAAELLLGFLTFFGNNFDYAKWEVNCRLGQIRIRETINSNNRRQSGGGFWVMDPFLINRNVANMVRGQNVIKIKSSFQSAHLRLQTEGWSFFD